MLLWKLLLKILQISIDLARLKKPQGKYFCPPSWLWSPQNLPVRFSPHWTIIYELDPLITGGNRQLRKYRM